MTKEKSPDRKLAREIQKVTGHDYTHCLRLARETLTKYPDGDVSSYLAERERGRAEQQAAELRERRELRNERRAALLNGWVM